MAASVMACRVAALFSSRREGTPGSPEAAVWAAEGDGDGGTRLHYVHVCTLGKYFKEGVGGRDGRRPGAQGLSWAAALPELVR
jgi:hypothetical protein